jgi:hypothetical protein
MGVSSVKTTTHIFKVIDGLKLAVDVHVPVGFSQETGLIVLHFHGGFLVSFELRN